jgi:hypothetical protein
MKMTSFSLLLAAFLAVVPGASAHHSISAEFDSTKWAAISGTITKIEWTNPHAFFYVDVKDPKTGVTLNWACELPNPKALAVRGWTTDSLKVGMTVNVRGMPARDGGRKVNARTVAVNGAGVLCAGNC